MTRKLSTPVLLGLRQEHFWTIISKYEVQQVISLNIILILGVYSCISCMTTMIYYLGMFITYVNHFYSAFLTYIIFFLT